MQRDDGERTRRAELVLTLRTRGVRTTRTLRAIETIPRSLFTPPWLADLAYADRALPIACGQTIEAPSHVATVTDALDVTEGCSVLEIGTGSGYWTAILARLGKRVVTVERWRTLSESARKRIDQLEDRGEVTFVVADGSAGRPHQAPFDRILISAATSAPPSAVINQLAPGGVLIAPVGGPDKQRVTRYLKTAEGGLEETTIGEARLPPLMDGVAAAL